MTPVIGVTATLKEDVDQVAERPLGHFVRADLDYVAGVAEAGGAPVVVPPGGGAGAGGGGAPGGVACGPAATTARGLPRPAGPRWCCRRWASDAWRRP